MATINKTLSEINSSIAFADELRNLKTPSEIESAVSEVQNGLNVIESRGAFSTIDFPDEELRKIPVKIFYKDGNYTTNFNARDWEPKSFDATFYVSQASGDKANSGAAISDALSELDDALDLIISHAGTNFELIILDGYFDRLTGWRGRQIGSKNLVVRCIGDVTSSGEFSGLTWASEGSGTYSASRSSTGVIYDKLNVNELGDWTQLAPVPSQAECISTPNSTFTDGSTIFVHRSDGLQPSDSNTMIGTSTINVRPAENGTTIIYGMKMYGGSDAISCNMLSNLNSNVILVDCKSGYTQTNAADFNGARLAISYNHTCIGAGNDGFNYQSGTNGVEQLALEINCTSRTFGIYSDDDYNNATSMHDQGVIVRVNGDYRDSRGPVVADVQQSKAWNINCIAGGSVAESGAQNTAYQNLGNSESWLLDCESLNVDDFDVYSVSGAYLRNSPTLTTTTSNVSGY